MRDETRLPHGTRIRRLLGLCIALALLFGARVEIGVAQSADGALAVSPAVGRAGAIVWLTGDNFGTRSTGTIYWDEEAIRTVPIEDGAFQLPFVIPLESDVGTHTIIVCAGTSDDCLTESGADLAKASFTVTAARSTFDAAVALVVSKADDPQAQDVVDLLAVHGLRTTIVPLAELATTDLARFRLVIVGPDTGSGDTWGTDPEQVKILAGFPRILGWGKGGHAFFRQVDSPLAWPEARSTTLRTLVTGDPGLAFYRQPVDAAELANHNPNPLFTRDVETVLLPMLTEPGAQILAYAPDQSVTVARHGCDLFWGYNGAVELMNESGRGLFVNAVVEALLSPCAEDQADSCRFDPDPRAFPTRLTFDELAPESGPIADAYVDEHGVRFEDSNFSRVLPVSDPDNARSEPMVALNEANEPYTNNNISLGIRFEFPQTAVGFSIGNGGEVAPAALLTAYDSNGRVICRTTHAPVPEPHEAFMGIRDDAGRISRVELDYGNTAQGETIDDLLLDPTRVLVCRRDASGACAPVPDAPIHLIRNGVYTHQILHSDADGYVVERNQIRSGDTLWAQVPISATDRYTLYHTTPVPVPVTANAFRNGGVMTVDASHPLIVHDLTVSAQWDMSQDTEYQAQLWSNLQKASNHFYDFTDGQFALGNVTVYQNYDHWDEADVRLYGSNSVHPQAVIGGVLDEKTLDPLVPDHTYYPGHIYVGTSWTRTGTPIRSAAGADVTDDWAIALAHELGHYLLFLYDTYLGLDENGDATWIDTCTGSAMGWVYEDENTEFVADEVHWNEACASTLANQILTRTEWATILLWYRDLLAPRDVNPGPPAPYVPLTKIVFVPPSTPGGALLSNTTFDLAYAEGETASPAARGFLIRNDRVLDQGQPVSGTTTIDLSGPQVGDRFCLFDVASDEISRHQFGCEIVEEGDNTLTLEKDVSWEPFVEVSPITSRTIAISVTQPLAAGEQLKAVLYPEDQNTATAITLAASGDDRHTGVFESSIPATSAYVSVFVDESTTENDPRREVMVDYGVGGSGAEGPASRWGYVPIISSDGQAQYANRETIELDEGEFVSWQSMAGHPRLSTDRRLLGRTYKLLALPAQLAEDGIVSIVLPDDAAASTARQGVKPVLYFWTGSQWRPLTSRQVTNREGETVVVADSEGVGIYSLQMVRTDGPRTLYLPTIQR